MTLTTRMSMDIDDNVGFLRRSDVNVDILAKHEQLSAYD
jgi:hypothetical protein